MNQLNQEMAVRKGTPYVFTARPAAATGFAPLNATFNHATTVGTKESLIFPLGLELTGLAVERALENFKLGQGKVTDILALSFSSHDYLAHHYGPDAMGLTADHGGPPLAEWAQKGRLPAGHIGPEVLSKQINSRLNDKFGEPKVGEWVNFVTDLNFFISPQAVLEKNLSHEKVEAEAKAEIEKTEWALFVFTHDCRGP